MYVQVRDGLADSIVDRNKRAFGIYRRFNRSRQKLRRRKHWACKVERQLQQRYMMLARTEQKVSGKQRVAVQKSHAVRVFIDDIR